MKKTTVKKVIDILLEHPEQSKMLPILFPETFKKLTQDCIVCNSNPDETLQMSDSILAYHLAAFNKEPKAVEFILDIFGMGIIEALVQNFNIPNEVIQKQFYVHEFRGKPFLRPKYELKHSIVMPDFKELERRLSALTPQYFCSIGQTFMRKNYPNNTYAVIKHNGKVCMINLTHSTIWDESRTIRLSDLRDPMRTRLTVDEFKKIVVTERFDDFVRIDLKLKPNGAAEVSTYQWETKTTAAWNKR